MKNKEVFKIREGEQDIELAVRRPSPDQEQRSMIVYASTWKKAQAEGAYVRAQLDSMMRSQGLWTDADDVNLFSLNSSLSKNEDILAGGSKNLKSIAEGIELAKQIRKDRFELMKLNARRNSLDQYTAESIADIARINYLASVCIVYNTTGKPYFSSVEDLYDRSNSDAAVLGVTKLTYLLNNYDETFFDTLPENKFLSEYGDEETEEVEQEIIFQPFLDESGKPIKPKKKKK